MCYWGSWSTYRKGDGKFTVNDIDPNLCTTIIYSFAGLNDKCELKVLDPWLDLPDQYNKDGNAISRTVALKEKNPKLKVLIAMGGWNEFSDGKGKKYSAMANDPTCRAKFIDSVKNFLDKHNLDGFDVDWEYPAVADRGGAPEDKENFVTLLREMKEVFTQHKYN